MFNVGIYRVFVPVFLSFILNFILVYGNLFFIKKNLENKYPLILSFIGIISTFIIYIEVRMMLYLFIIINFVGLLGWIKYFFKDFKKRNFKNIFYEKWQIFLLVFISLICALILNYEHFPMFLYKLDKTYLYSKFYDLDVFYRALLSKEILIADYIGRIRNPIGYPLNLHTYYIGAESITSFFQLFLYPKLNVITYSYIHWFNVTLGLTWLFFYATKINVENDTGTKFINKILSIVLSAFFISFLGLFGKLYSIIAYFNYNAPSFYGAFFLAVGTVNLIRKKYAYFLYFLWAAVVFKISLIIIAGSLSFLFLIQQKVFLDRRLMRQFFYPVCFPIISILYILYLSYYDIVFFPFLVKIRLSFDIDPLELKNWILPFYSFIFEKFNVVGNVRKILAGIVLLMPVFYGCMFLFVVLMNKAIFKIKNLINWNIFIVGLFLSFFSGFSIILFKTYCPMGVYAASIDPWITNLMNSKLAEIIFIVYFCNMFLIMLSNIENKFIVKMITFFIIGFCLFYIKPDKNIVSWDKREIEKMNIISHYNILKVDDSISAGFLGKRISYEANNKYGIKHSIKPKLNLLPKTEGAD